MKRKSTVMYAANRLLELLEHYDDEDFFDVVITRILSGEGFYDDEIEEAEANER